MELDSFVHRIQSILKSKQKSLGDLDTIKPGDEDAITQVLDSLKLISDGAEEPDNSKQTLYILLFLNINTNVYNDLKKNVKYAHLVGFFPKLSPALFIRIVCSLKLHQYLYESVYHFCSPLSYQLIHICLNFLNWIDLFEGVTFVEHLLSSLFKKILLIDDNDPFNSPLKDSFQRLLLHYDSEKSGCIKRMSQWKNAKLKHYAGLMVASLLSLLEKCTRIYLQKEDNSKDIGSKYKIEIDEETMRLKTKAISELGFLSVQQCYEHVVSKCYENVCSITVDIWLFWVEIDLDDVPDTENTLQRFIGGKAYTCRETLKEAECAGVSCKESADLVLKLTNLALKPPSEYDYVDSMSLIDILSNIQDSNKDTKKWIKFLISKPFVMEPSALKVIKNYINEIEIVDLEKLWKLLLSYIKTNEDNKLHKQFLLDMVKILDIESQVTLSKYYVDNFKLGELLMTDQFQVEIVETFNKVIKGGDKDKELYSQFVRLALQSPELVIDKAVADGISSAVRGEMMTDILDHLKPFCQAHHTSSSCIPSTLLAEALTKVLNNLPSLPEVSQNNYPFFVQSLVVRGVLCGNKFTSTNLKKTIYNNLKTKNWIVSKACLTTMIELDGLEINIHRPAMLSMMLQVLEASRWTPSTFSMAAARVCESAVKLIEILINRSISTPFQDNHYQRISEFAHQKISPINYYYLNPLMEDEPMPSDLALQLIYKMHWSISGLGEEDISTDNRLKLVLSLCYVLPLLTTQEWQKLFKIVRPKFSEFLRLFHIVTDALLLCVDSAKVRALDAVMRCLGFAAINVGQAIDDEVTNWNNVENEHRINILSKMCQLITAFPASEQEQFCMSLVMVLQKLLPEGGESLSAELMNRVTAALASLQAVDVREALAREFLQIVHRH